MILLPQFGQNKVQYDYFDWNFIQTKHFDIYYYGEGSNLIDFIAKQSEDAYDNHSSRMGWKLQNRIAIIIFNSHNEEIISVDRIPPRDSNWASLVPAFT